MRAQIRSNRLPNTSILTVASYGVLAGLLMLAFQTRTFAQADVRGTLGYAAFPDNAWNDHVAAGGSVMVNAWSGVQMGVEALVLSGLGDDRDVLLAPMIGYEFGTRRVRPFVVAGIGLLHHRDRVGTGLYSSNGATYGAGGGLKFYISDHWFVAPEVRLGWEPAVRMTFSLGYRF